MTWMSASNRRALRFVHGDEIENFIARENLPDYAGGTCKLDAILLCQDKEFFSWRIRYTSADKIFTVYQAYYGGDFLSRAIGWSIHTTNESREIGSV